MNAVMACILLFHVFLHMQVGQSLVWVMMPRQHITAADCWREAALYGYPAYCARLEERVGR